MIIKKFIMKRINSYVLQQITDSGIIDNDKYYILKKYVDKYSNKGYNFKETYYEYDYAVNTGLEPLHGEYRESLVSLLRSNLSVSIVIDESLYYNKSYLLVSSDLKFNYKSKHKRFSLYNPKEKKLNFYTKEEWKMTQNDISLLMEFLNTDNNWKNLIQLYNSEINNILKYDNCFKRHPEKYLIPEDLPIPDYTKIKVT